MGELSYFATQWVNGRDEILTGGYCICNLVSCAPSRRSKQSDKKQFNERVKHFLHLPAMFIILVVARPREVATEMNSIHEQLTKVFFPPPLLLTPFSPGFRVNPKP